MQSVNQPKFKNWIVQTMKAATTYQSIILLSSTDYHLIKLYQVTKIVYPIGYNNYCMLAPKLMQ